MMGVNHIRPAFPSKAFRELALSLTKGLPLLFLASLALFRCDFFDIFPPEIEIVSPKEGTSYFATLPIELKATDNRRVDKVEVFVNGTSVHEFTKSPYKTDISLAGVSSPATLQVVAHDQAGNSAEASRDVNVTIGLRLTSPNGGETWPENSTQSVTWESSGSVGSTVGLHYSTDGGSTWDEITTSTANNGTYAWTLPNFSETQSACKIKVSTSQYADDSDDTFTISAEPNTLTLTAPNGGETWAEQSTQTVTWSYSGDVGDYVSLDYSIDGGTNWIEIIASTSNDGSHTWNIPNFLDTRSACRVKVASTSTAFADTSDADFTITTEPNFISLTSPNGGEVWAEQSTQTILWTYGGDVGDYVSLHLSLDNGSSWNQIVASTPNDGSYDWSLPNLFETATTCLIRVNGTTTSFADTSDADFTITAEPNYIALTSPNGGENWPEQSTHDITWDRSGGVGSYVSLHYSTDGGTNWTEIVSSTENDGSYEWTLPNFTDTQTSCRVKIASTTTAYTDVSDAYFIIWAPTLAGIYNTPGSAKDVFVSGSYAYVADGSYGLQVINVSNPASPARAGSYNTPWGSGVFVSGSYAYVTSGYNGLQVVNVSNPASPTLAGTFNTPGYAKDVFVSGSYAYVADGSYGLRIINVSNPASPTLAGIYNTPGNAQDVFVSGNYAYVADGYYSLQIVDVSNPASPTLAGSYDTPDFAHDVFVSGDYANVAAEFHGLQVINVADPASPTLAGSYNTPGLAHGVFVSGSYAYVADGSYNVVDEFHGLQVINVADPASPTLAGSYNTPGDARGVFVSGDHAYVADGESGLLIFDVSGLP